MKDENWKNPLIGPDMVMGPTYKEDKDSRWTKIGQSKNKLYYGWMKVDIVKEHPSLGLVEVEDSILNMRFTVKREDLTKDPCMDNTDLVYPAKTI